jgi:hypothetical protein
VLTPGQKSKLENVKREEYPTNFALSLMHKDFSLVLSRAYDLSVSMPATAAAQQTCTAAMAKGMDKDFSIMIQFMEELAGLSTISDAIYANEEIGRNICSLVDQPSTFQRSATAPGSPVATGAM